MAALPAWFRESEEAEADIIAARGDSQAAGQAAGTQQGQGADGAQEAEGAQEGQGAAGRTPEDLQEKAITIIEIHIEI